MLLDELESRPSLTQPGCVRERIDALDAIDRCLALSDAADDPLLSRADVVVGQLEAINTALYRSIRDDIRLGRGAASLLQLVASAAPPEGDGYDALDELEAFVARWNAEKKAFTDKAAGK